MNDEHIRYHIRKAVSVVSGITIDRISDDARFDEDLGMDSLSIIESLVLLEREFKLEPPDADAELKINSVIELMQLVQVQMSRKAG